MASITCGNCKGTHDSVAAVKACYAQAQPLDPTVGAKVAPVAKPSINGPAATDKQRAFIAKLAAQRVVPVAGATEHEAICIATAENAAEGKFISKSEASAAIDYLLTLPKAQGKAQGTTVELDDGVHAYEGTYYLVYHTVHGSNQQVAKRLVITPVGDKFEGEWIYEGKKPLHFLRPEHKLSQDEARVFGETYGICVRCAKDLTKDESKYVGYGATCAGHEGWWYPTKSELKALTAKAAPVAVEHF